MGQLLIVCGAALALVGWRQVHRGRGTLVTGGLYRFVRHPQYPGLFLIFIGSIVNWPPLPTLLMLPVLGWVYYRLARTEEAEAEAAFGEAYRDYRQRSGMFFPCLRKVTIT